MLRNIIGDNIRCLRTRLGWSQEILGSKCGISRDYIGRIERGEVNIGTDHLDRISHTLELKVHLLLKEGYCFSLIQSQRGEEANVIKEITIPPLESSD